MYTISLENFSGPLEKLLELIEQKKMDITSIALAEVTGDFIAYAQQIKRAYEEDVASEVQRPNSEVELRKEYARLVSDFLVIAAHLVFVKSRALLPQLVVADEEEGSFDLEKQLQIYALAKPLFAELKKFWAQSDQSFSRDFLKTTQPVFYPPPGLTAHDLAAGFEKATATVGSLVKEEQKIERQLVTLEEKIEELSSSVLQGIQKFSSLAGERTKHEVIVLFLALLHLLRDRMVHVKQEGQFGEIEFEQQVIKD
jgi:segregation and condensation protein A